VRASSWEIRQILHRGERLAMSKDLSSVTLQGFSKKI
jgi:hypothetical protein